MNKKEKIIHFANFNITFGDEKEPMLAHFCDVIYPAFLSDFKRGKTGEGPVFYLNDVKLKKIGDEVVLVGNHIKDTTYDVHTVFKDGELVSNPSTVPTAPYSRFIIFLKNHKMVVVRNESQSPDIRSFQATVREILKSFIRMENKKEKDKENRIPKANINIVDMHCHEDISEMFEDVDKIRSVEFKFFPANGDIDTEAIANHIDKELKEIGGSGATLKYTSPTSKSETVSLLERISGFAKATINVIDFNGLERTIRDSIFTSSSKIKLEKNIEPSDDAYICEQAKGNKTIAHVSEMNESIYDKFKNNIFKLF